MAAPESGSCETAIASGKTPAHDISTREIRLAGPASVEGDGSGRGRIGRDGIGVRPLLGGTRDRSCRNLQLNFKSRRKGEKWRQAVLTAKRCHAAVTGWTTAAIVHVRLSHRGGCHGERHARHARRACNHSRGENCEEDKYENAAQPVHDEPMLSYLAIKSSHRLSQPSHAAEQDRKQNHAAPPMKTPCQRR